jgi:multiple sugar transport system permease protein
MTRALENGAVADPARAKTGFRNYDPVTRFVVVLVMGLMLVYILMPVFWMVKSSFQTNLEVQAIPPIWLPETWSIDAYFDAGLLIPLWRYMFNSLVVSVVSAVITTAIAASGAYVLARYKFPGAMLILGMILATQLIPAITRVFPVYFLVQDLQLLNTYAGLILAYVGFSLPFAILLLRGYFQTSSPPELEEAAMIDGCTHFGAFWRVILPISLPGLAAVTVFSFLNSWNDFLWASLLLSSGAMKTVQVGIGDFASEGGGVQYINAFMAACVIATIPALILFFFVQRWLVSGLTAGAVKG